MWKQRIFALILLAASVGIGYFVYVSQASGKKPFKLGLDLSGGTYLVYRADTSKVPAADVSDAMESLRRLVEKRIDPNGVAENRVATEVSNLGGERENRLVIELPGVTDVKEAIQKIGKTPTLEFKIENPDFKPGETQEIQIDESSIKDGKIDLSAALNANSQFIPTELTGKYLSRANLQFDPTTQAPIVGLQFNDEGSKLFEKITEENVGKVVAIYLDGVLMTAPRVSQKITGGQAVITGNFTAAEAKQIVADLNSGALPMPIELISTDVIGPTLGSDAVSAGITAGIIGLIAIAVLLIVWYRVPGLIATLALAAYAVIMLALFKLVPVTLTSAGIAGFIISLGMAVDANILIFERMKEEMQSGKSLYESVSVGFERAWNSIRDGNISSLISAVILFWFGTTLIQGFAVTFGVGVLVSMITAISVSRIFLLATAGKGSGRIARFLFSSGISR